MSKGADLSDIIELIRLLAPLALELIRAGEAALGLQMSNHVNNLVVKAQEAV